ncbi:MAG TPA: MBL fold metallo-hydrolase [Terriglobales bacterium]|nr:MBL fold metallo-hydrolase [Terriglobales bacterium]
MISLDHPWAEPPAPGTTISVAPGIRWLRMPLPFALNHINLWLLDDGDGITVVDTGLGLPDTRALWEQIFAHELGGKPVTRVIATHFHPDHFGNAGWLTERWGVELWCTQGEYQAAVIACTARAMRPELYQAHYRRHGISEDNLAKLRERGNHYPGLVPTIPDSYRCLREGDRVRIDGRAWEVMVVLGHAPEHAALWCAEMNVLISGDQVLPKITTNVSIWADRPHDDPLRLYLESLTRFRPLPSDALVLPSHGLPFRGLHARLDALRAHHDERLSETLGALAEPRTAAELMPVLFRRQLDTHQLSFAIGEVLAHLNYLVAAGSVAHATGADGVVRFRKA